MAAVSHCATVSLLTPSKLPIKPLLIISSTSTTFTSKPTKRKNHLRPKIFKTLNPKPLPSTPLPTEKPINPIVSQPQNDRDLDPPPTFHEIPAEELSSSNVEDKVQEAVEEFQVPEATASVASVKECDSGSVSSFISAESVIKYGLYFVGAFVFQTVFAVWVMGNSDSKKRDNNLNNSEVGIDGVDRRNVLLSNSNDRIVLNAQNGSELSNVVYSNESGVEMKIKEIRAMANEVRKLEEEKLKMEGNGKVGGIFDHSVSSRGRSGIEKEIGARLVRVEKKLNSKHEKLPVSVMKHLDELGDVEDDEEEYSWDSSDAKKGNENLMFKKKFKFKNPSMNPIGKPRGFPGLANAKRGGQKVEMGDRVVNLNGDSRESVLRNTDTDNGRKTASRKSSSLQNDEKKFEKERERVKTGADNTDLRSGAIQGTRESLPVEVMKSRNSRNLDPQNSQNFMKGKQDSTAKSDDHSSVDRNGSSKHGEAINEPLRNKVQIRPADAKADLWWLKLPFVFAILMHRGSYSEGLGGFYTLKATSEEEDDSDSSYVVAFENRGDANNLCYLLESFFEELGDFRADTVPLSIKELHETVDSDVENIIVVKKGQLKLYAGQPLSDVEAALHSLIQG